jgi:small conductance mechanosensitive channel
MERELRKEIKEALTDAGIEIPYPKTYIVNNNFKS